MIRTLHRLHGGPLDGCMANMEHWARHGGRMPVIASGGAYVYEARGEGWQWVPDRDPGRSAG